MNHRAALFALVLLSCSGDPYARYGAAVHDDVDASMRAGFDMTARLHLTVVHNLIPFDSMAVVADVTARTARELLDHAAHFAKAAPPPELAQAHALLASELSHLAHALDTVATAFRRCADAHAASDCEAQLGALPSSMQFIGSDLMLARSRVQSQLLGHGVVIGR